MLFQAEMKHQDDVCQFHDIKVYFIEIYNKTVLIYSMNNSPEAPPTKIGQNWGPRNNEKDSKQQFVLHFEAECLFSSSAVSLDG